ncbi:MAG: indole-3-glycerol phosphate synthase TrpC [Bacteroidales bacterium]|nr:indole-3-glycerol phosphate synthase TrpC [Bacteroidales bacterium]
MNILDKIVSEKIKELEIKKTLTPVKTLEHSIYFNMPCVSMTENIVNPTKYGIIAEFKRRSPSKGLINNTADVEQTTIGYVEAGASALSVLTDEVFFGGSTADLLTVRKVNSVPVLRKDFTIDEYQIIEAKSIGADAILLIAAILNKQKVKEFAELAHSLGLQVLLEVHNENELSVLCEAIDMLGVNNRNLKDFSVNIQTSINLAKKIPDELVKISESGLSKPENIIELRKYGFQGFLMGENFMKTANPAKTCSNFINELQKLS